MRCGCSRKVRVCSGQGLAGVELSVGNNIMRLFSCLYTAASHTWTLFFLCVFILILLVLLYVLLS